MAELPLPRLAVAFAAFAACTEPEYRPAAFDLAASRRADDLQPQSVTLASPTPAAVRLSEISFDSREWTSEGAERRITIKGFLARPAAPTQRPWPAVLVAHGLGQRADAGVAVDIAQHLKVVALALSAPGMGQSAGRAVTFEDPSALFDAAPDVRGSWLYGYVFALLRAITFLRAQPDVDPSSVTLSGVSLGGLAALIANGVDDRITGVLAAQASGGLGAAARAGGWLGVLVGASGGQKPDDRGPANVFRALDPLAFATRQHGAVYLLAGAQDEFFPLDQIVRTFEMLAAPAKSLALVPDFDHQWYFGSGCPAPCMPGAPERLRASVCPDACPKECSASARWPYCGPEASYNRHDDVIARWAALLRALVARSARDRDHAFGAPPATPVVRRGPEEVVVLTSDPAPRAVRVAVSDNGGYTYGQFRLTRGPHGAYTHRGTIASGAIVFAEVEASNGTVSTSVPALPARFVPIIRPFAALPVGR